MNFYNNDYYLEHKDRSWKNHKYISKKKVNGRWVYTYNNPEARNYRQMDAMDTATGKKYFMSSSPKMEDEYGMYDNIDDLIASLKKKRSENMDKVTSPTGTTSSRTYADNVKQYDKAIAEAQEIKDKDVARNTSYATDTYKLGSQISMGKTKTKKKRQRISQVGQY